MTMIADAAHNAAGSNANVIDGSRTWLTKRERDVLDLRCEGLTIAQIAQALGVALKTVETHLANAKAVARAHTHFELLARYVRGELDVGAGVEAAAETRN